jgi:pyruvate, orthophosphate dikinase
MQIEFTLEAGELRILDAVRVQRSSRAEVRIAVSLAADGIIRQEEAVLRVAPRAMSELLHRQVDPRGTRDTCARGIAASPGAATGKIVFTSRSAQAAASREEPCILVRRETTPEDIRGMHASVGVLTERGGMSSHAAVIARGLGLPAVVGASGVRLNRRDKTLTMDDGRVFREGDTITIDGSTGQVLAGAAPLLEPALDDAFRTLLGWAEAASDIGVRANADTPSEARMARAFNAEGIGLCRTEHMFFTDDRMTVMHEMIFADTSEGRAAALARLLPMQRADFISLFEIMQGFRSASASSIRRCTSSCPRGVKACGTGRRDEPAAEPGDARAEALSEFNPMLGMRGVRLGITVPEIYDMQARAIFEATAEVSRSGDPVVPEVMIPLVSAKREVELVKARIDAVAARVRGETGVDFAIGSA